MSATVSVIIAIICSLGCLASVIFYLRAKDEAIRRLLLSPAAIWALFVATVLLPQATAAIAGWILAGLALVAGADVLRFLRSGDPKDNRFFLAIAAVLSAVGYLLCANGLMAVCRPEWEGVLSLFLVVLIAALSYKKRKGIHPQHGLQIPVLLHLCAVLFMGSLGIALAVRNPNAGLILMGLGGLCSILGVNGLLAYAYGKKPTPEQYLFARGSHFLALLLMGWSILFL